MRTQWFTQEIDASQVVGSVSTSVAVFAGDFNKGPVQDYIQIGTVQELIDYYGYPDNENYNDWYQAYNFLQYANTLLISRACNINGSVQKLDGTTITSVGVETDSNDDDAVLVQDAIPASSEIGTANIAGAQGNEIVVSVTNGTPIVVEQAVAASCKYGTAKNAGVEGNELKVTVAQNADAITFDVTVSNDMVVYTKTQVTSTNDLEENDYIIWTPDVDLAVEEVQLENGKDAVMQETFNVTTKSGFDEELTQENVKSSQELQDNEYVIFNKEIALAVKDYTFAGGADPIYKNMFKIGLSNIANVQVDDTVQFQEEIEGAERYKIKAIDLETRVITLDRELPEDPDDQPQLNSDVFKVQVSFNGSCEASSINNTQETQVSVTETETITVDVPNDVGDEYTQFDYNKQVLNDSDFEANFDSIAFSNPVQAKVKFIARNPGKWSDSLRICIARPESFEANNNSGNHVPHYAFEGLPVDDYFEYAPKGTQVGILIYDEDEEEVLETYTVDFNPDAKDYNNKSTYIENVINQQSSYVFVKVNSANDNEIADYTLVYDALEGDYVGKTLRLMNSSDSPIQRDDLLDAYDLFANKEEIDIDIVIANELDNGESARSLVTTREDCVGFIGCRYEDVVAKKSAIATDNLVTWRKNIINYNSSFLVACGNYCYIYDRYADRYRWVNIAGHIAGLRAQTNFNQATWWASAGIERGQLLNVTKLAFNPTQAQRDTLYKNAINPIVTFPGQGTVCWGQKTLQDTASAFDRLNIRALFNYLERSLAKLAKSKVMEFNDTYTRNSIVSAIKPFLSTVQAGRGIQDFLVICDTTNNTADVIAHNQLVVDIYIKPTYVAEFILLRFTNAGTNSFSEIVNV